MSILDILRSALLTSIQVSRCVNRPSKRACQPDDMVRTNPTLQSATNPIPAHSHLSAPCSFPPNPRLQLRVHYPIKTACMRRCAVPKSTWIPRLQLHTYILVPRTSKYLSCTPRAMPCSHARSSERVPPEKRQGLGKGLL